MTVMSDAQEQISVSVKDEGPCRKIFQIQIPASTVDKEYAQTLKNYQRAVRIPGFRPGKAPVQLVQNHYRKQILEELQERLIPQGYRQAVTDSGLDVVSVLHVTEADFKKGQQVSVDVTVDVAPEFKLPKYTGIPLKVEEAAITDDEVNTSYEEFLSYYGTYSDIHDRPVKEGDLVQVDFTATLDGKPLGDIDAEAETLNSREDFWVRSGDEAFLPGFGVGLIGLSEGDNKDIEITFEEAFIAKKLAGQTAVFATSVKAIREKVAPELTDEFFAKIQVASADELRDRIRTDLEQAAEEKEKSRQGEVLVTHLLDSTEMALPDSEVSQETQSVIQDIVKQNTSKGVSPDQIKENKEEIFEAASRNAQNSIKLRYILHRISEEEDINVSDEEFSEHIATMAAGYRMEPENLLGELKHRNAVDNVRMELRHRKSMDFVMAQASITT